MGPGLHSIGALNWFNQDLVELLATVDFSYPDLDFDLSVDFLPGPAERLFQSYASWETPTRASRYLSQLRDFLATLPLYLGTRTGEQSQRVWRPSLAFPKVPVNKPSRFVQFAPLSELRARLEGAAL
jgi:hypothetical protein